MNRPELIFQYFNKINKCRAVSSLSADCVCWHDEGTGPYKSERHDAKTPLVDWRIKPKVSNDKS